jgi:hypothetical protein
MPTLLWPRRSLATLGCTPEANRCVACVPQIVESDAGQGAPVEKADPLLAEAVRPQGQAIGSRRHEVVIR